MHYVTPFVAEETMKSQGHLCIHKSCSTISRRQSATQDSLEEQLFLSRSTPYGRASSISEPEWRYDVGHTESILRTGSTAFSLHRTMRVLQHGPCQRPASFVVGLCNGTSLNGEVMPPIDSQCRIVIR